MHIYFVINVTHWKRVSFLSHTFQFKIFLKSSCFYFIFNRIHMSISEMQVISAAASLRVAYSFIIHKEIKIVMKPVGCLVTLPRTDKVITTDQCFNLFIFHFFCFSLYVLSHQLFQFDREACVHLTRIRYASNEANAAHESARDLIKYSFQRWNYRDIIDFKWWCVYGNGLSIDSASFFIYRIKCYIINKIFQRQ